MKRTKKQLTEEMLRLIVEKAAKDNEPEPDCYCLSCAIARLAKRILAL